MCGGRDFNDRGLLHATLDQMHLQEPIGCIISGGARGADELGELWAHLNRVALLVCPANWKHMGKGAGKVRNLWMLDFAQPDEVVAFPGGAGTADMVTKARRQKIPVRKVS